MGSAGRQAVLRPLPASDRGRAASRDLGADRLRTSCV